MSGLTKKGQAWAQNMQALAAAMPTKPQLYLIVNATQHGFAFRAGNSWGNSWVYVLSETKYYAFKPSRGKTTQSHAKVYVRNAGSKHMLRLSNYVPIRYHIPSTADYMPIGYKYKTPAQYKRRHVTIIPFPVLKGFGGAVERRSGGTQEVRMTFSVPARVEARFGPRQLAFTSAFFFQNTIKTIELADSYSRGSAVGFTTDLINSKDEPTHWGTVINGQSRVVQPMGPVH